MEEAHCCPIAAQPEGEPRVCAGCVRHKAKPRDDASLRKLQSRLNRMIGQLSGIGRMLEENLGSLNESLSALDQYSDEMERLKQGLRLLKAEEGVKDLLPLLPGPMEVLDAAEQYYRDLLLQAEAESRASRAAELLLFIAEGLAAAALLLALMRERVLLPAALSGALAALLSLMALFFWRSRCPMLDDLLPWAALALTVSAALFSELLFRRRRALRGKRSAEAAEAS